MPRRTSPLDRAASLARSARRGEARSLARKAVVRGVGTVAAHVPPVARLPHRVVVAGLVDQSRLRLRRRRDPAAALAVLRPALVRPGAAAALWVAAAQAEEAAGEPHQALEAARRATDAPRPSAEAFLVRRRLAEALGEPGEVEETLQRLAARRPASATEGRDTLRELARSARHLLDTFGDTVAHTRLVDHNWLEQLRAETRLAGLHGEDAAGFAAEAARVRAEVADGDRVVLRVLAQSDDWPAAAELAGSVPDDQVPAKAVRDAARRALRAGYASPAAVLARRVLESGGDRDPVVSATLAEAEDQVRVAAYGLDLASPERPAAPPYDVEPRHVLAVLAQSLPWTSGGYATRSHGILTSLRDRGWEPEVVTRLGFPYDRWPADDARVAPATDLVDGLAYHRLLGGPTERAYPQYPLAAYVARTAEGVVRRATEHRAALLHASSFHVNGLATTVAARRLGLPHIYEMRGLDDLMRISRNPAYAETDRYRFTTGLELANCLAADRVFVITEALRAEMADRGVPAEKMVVLPNGVHAHRFEPRPRDRELEAELGYAGRTVIGYAGGLVDYEGLDLLLEAVAELRASRDADDVRLLVVGDGHYDRELRALSARLRLDGVVRFTGRVPHAEVSRYLSLVDITPFPRKPLPVCELISPIKPFEAMAMGKAAVVSSVAALTEIVHDEDTGLVFAKGDPHDLARVLGRLVDDPALRTRLGERAQQWVRAERDWSQVVAVADDVYAELTGVPARR